MFVRVKKIGAYEYLYLVENAREGGRHVQRVIKALGRRAIRAARSYCRAFIAANCWSCIVSASDPTWCLAGYGWKRDAATC